MKNVLLSVLFILSLSGIGCRTAATGVTQQVPVSVKDGAGAEVFVNGILAGTVSQNGSPLYLKLRKGPKGFAGIGKEPHDYRVSVQKAGFEPAGANLTSVYNWREAGVDVVDIASGLHKALSLAVDSATGAEWKIVPTALHFDLQPVGNNNRNAPVVYTPVPIEKKGTEFRAVPK